MSNRAEGAGATPGQEPASKGDGQGAPEGLAQRAEPPLIVQAQYVKDLSFEAPGAPNVFSLMQKTKPEMQVRVEVQTRPLAERVHEVVLHIRAECKVGEASAFLLELSYGGIFTVNLPKEQAQAVLMIECPRMLFPFARQIVAAATLDGGFLPLMLAPIDFVGLYQRQMGEQRQRETRAANESEAT